MKNGRFTKTPGLYYIHYRMQWVDVIYVNGYIHVRVYTSVAAGILAGANGVSAGSSLARLRHRW